MAASLRDGRGFQPIGLGAGGPDDVTSYALGFGALAHGGTDAPERIRELPAAEFPASRRRSRGAGPR